MRTREQHTPEAGSRTIDDLDRPNDTIEEGAAENIAFVYRLPQRRSGTSGQIPKVVLTSLIAAMPSMQYVSGW